MALTKSDLELVSQVVVSATAPMFEMVFERLDGIETRLSSVETRLSSVETRLSSVETRLDGVEQRLDSVEKRLNGVERELQEFRSYVTARLGDLEAKIAVHQEDYAERLENVDDDIKLLYTLVRKLEHGTKAEQLFAEEAIIQHLPAIYKAITLVAKKQNIVL